LPYDIIVIQSILYNSIGKLRLLCYIDMTGSLLQKKT